jgi:hypothetical protein
MAIQSLVHIRKALNSLNPNQVRELSSKPVHVTLHAPDDSAYREMEDFFLQDLRPVRRRESAQLISRGDRTVSLPGEELVVYHRGLLAPSDALMFNPADPEDLIHSALHRYPDAGIPLSRSFFPFRKPFIRQVISKTSRENTLFSLTTALPDIIPSVIELPWAVAEFASDTAFLTMNQVRMAFLIAAASDRDIGYREQKSEIATVIGSAFGWRALAKQLVGKIPFGGGLIAKAAVAYAGTKVLGLSLDHYYSIGFTYSRAERDRLYADAFRQGKKVAFRILSHTRPDIAKFFSESPEGQSRVTQS